MASVVSIAAPSDKPWRRGLRKRRYQITLLDNAAVEHVIITRPVKQRPAEDGTRIAAALLQAKKDAELFQGERVARWADSQAEYDRRALGRAMTITDVDEFYSYLPLFKAMEVRGGANANQRASYLGVSNANYGLMEDRFNDAEGISFFLDNTKAQVWDEIPDEFQ